MKFILSSCIFNDISVRCAVLSFTCSSDGANGFCEASLPSGITKASKRETKYSWVLRTWVPVAVSSNSCCSFRASYNEYLGQAGLPSWGRTVSASPPDHTYAPQKPKNANINPSCKSAWHRSLSQGGPEPVGAEPSSPELSVPALSLKDNLQYQQTAQVMSLCLLKHSCTCVLCPVPELSPKLQEISQLWNTRKTHKPPSVQFYIIFHRKILNQFAGIH